MKKLTTLFNTPAKAVIAVGLIVVAVELLFMMAVEDFVPLSMHKFLYLIDPVLLIAIISPALYFLIFKPMRTQHAEIEVASRKIEQAHQEWMDALDVVSDPIFLHDKDFRILRCNKAYQRCAGIPFGEVIGQLYYEVFPKTGTPLPCCLRAMAKAEEEEEEEVTVGEAIYRSRAFSIKDEQGAYLYSVHTLEDITESRRAETRLQLFHDLIDQSKDGISIVDPDTSRFLMVNEALCRDMGYTREELLQRGVLDIQTDIRDVATWQAHTQALRTQGHFLLEFSSLCKDGSRHPVETSLRYYVTKDGAYIIAVVRDITERKHAEAELRESEERFRAYVEQAADALFVHDFSGRFLDVNQRACISLGYSREELLRMSVFDVEIDFDLAKAQAAWSQILPGQTFMLLGHQRRKDGTTFPVEVQFGCFDLKGERCYMGMARDITERKRAEESLQKSEKLYRSLFEHMLNGFAYCRMIFENDQPQDFIYLNVNAAFETLTGLKNVAGKKVSEVIPGIRQSDPKIFEIYGRVSLSGQSEQLEIYVEALQQWFWISVYSPEKGYFVAVFDVITERKRAEAQLTEQLEELHGWYDVTLGREMRVLELKHEVDELLAQAGQPPRYPGAEDNLQEK